MQISISSLISMINSFYVCHLPYFDNSMINLTFPLAQPIHDYEYFS